MVPSSTLEHWSLEAHAQRFLGCHHQRQASSSTGAAAAAHRQLALEAVVVVRWSKNLDVMFIMFEMICTSCELLIAPDTFRKKYEKYSDLSKVVFDTNEHKGILGT
jgi:hypothetical protein